MPTRRDSLTIVAAPALALLAGCVTEGGPKAVRPPPRGLVPHSLTMVTQNPVDTNENGYRDTMPVVIYVFGSDPSYPSPFTVAGAFDFYLVDAEGRRIRDWSFLPDATARAVRKLAPGPGYVFTLSLLEGGDDALEAGNARLVGILRQEDFVNPEFPPTDARNGPGSISRGSGDIRAESPPLLVGPVHQTPRNQR